MRVAFYLLCLIAVIEHGISGWGGVLIVGLLIAFFASMMPKRGW